MSKKAIFNIIDALDKWEHGWCWNAIGDKYGYSGRTIKKYTKLAYINLSRSRKWHERNHQKSCSKCNPVIKHYQKTFI